MTIRDKKWEIMKAAEILFSNRRFHEITLDEVAQKAKVGKGTIYRYFANKDDLFFQTATSGFDSLCHVVESCMTKEKNFTDQLLSACLEITQFFRQRHQLFRLMQVEEGRVIWSQGSLWDLWMARRQKLVLALSRILETGASENKIRRDVPPSVLADFLLGMLRTRARYLARVDDLYRRLELLLDIFLFGASSLKNECGNGDRT